MSRSDVAHRDFDANPRRRSHHFRNPQRERFHQLIAGMAARHEMEVDESPLQALHLGINDISQNLRHVALLTGLVASSLPVPLPFAVGGQKLDAVSVPILMTSRTLFRAEMELREENAMSG